MKNVIYFLILFILYFPLLGQCSDEFQVNPDSLGLVWCHAVTALIGVGFVIGWINILEDSEKIFVQLYDSVGSKIGGTVLVTADVQINYSDLIITHLPDGGFVVCWHSWQQPDDDTNISLGIFSQLFHASGHKNGSLVEITNDSKNILCESKVASLTNGDFVVCWLLIPPGGGSLGTAIIGQIFDKSSSKKYGEFRVDASVPNYLCLPSITSLPKGGFALFWGRVTGDGSYSDIYGQIFNEYADKIGIEFQVNTNTKISVWYQPMQFLPTASLRNSDLVACWHSCINNSGWDIIGQRINPFGKKMDDEFRVNTYTPSYAFYPTIAPLTTGGFVVCWSSFYCEWQIIGQLYDASGTKNGCEFRIDSDHQTGNFYPIATPLSNCGFVVVWEISGTRTARTAILGRCYNPTLHHLQTFSLIKPQNDLTLSSSHPTFLWQQPSTIRECYPWELTFNLYLDTDSNFPHPQIIKNIQDTTYTIDSLAAGKTYFWKVLAKNLAGDSLWSVQQDWGFFIKPGATLVENADNELPQDFELFQNYPNPFNSSTVIKYSLAENSHVSLKIYDVNGRLVDEIILTNQERGEHEFRWTPQSLTSGVYLIKIQTQNWQKTIKAILLK